MTSRNYSSAETIALDQVRGHGGSMTIDFRTDEVQTQMLKTLNKLAVAGRLVKTTSVGGLVHTFTLPKPTTEA